MAIFRGTGTALVTPMHEDGTIHYEKLEELLEFQIRGGTDAIIICGTTGETATMTGEEHLETIRFAVEKVNGRIPVIAGTGSNCTRTAVRISAEAARMGVDGLLLVTPFYNKATQNGLAAHFTAIAEAAPDTPVILYNVPSRTGCNILPATVAGLVKNVKNIVGLKAASGNISQIADAVAACGKELDLYSGNDDQIVPIMALGGIGVISVLSNVAPKETHEMTAKMLSGDLAGARDLQIRFLPLIRALFCEVNPIPVKAALNMMGMEVGPVRLPLTELEEGHKEQLRAALQGAGLLA